MLTAAVRLPRVYDFAVSVPLRIPYRRLLLEKYGSQIALYAVAVFLNVFAGVYVAARKLFLKDTGRKLAHIEKQLRTGESISEELSRRLSEE